MKKALTCILSFCMICILSLILIEFFLRLTEISLPSRVYDDPRLGRSHKPNSKIFQASAEGFCIGRVNKFGYLGPAYDTQKRSNTFRIALIGDSYVAGLQLFDRLHFRKLLEDKLSIYMDMDVEVLNFGIGGIDFAIHCGRLAGKIASAAVKKDDFTEAGLSSYNELLRELRIQRTGYRVRFDILATLTRGLSDEEIQNKFDELGPRIIGIEY